MAFLGGHTNIRASQHPFGMQVACILVVLLPHGYCHGYQIIVDPAVWWLIRFNTRYISKVPTQLSLFTLSNLAPLLLDQLSRALPAACSGMLLSFAVPQELRKLSCETVGRPESERVAKAA